MADFWTSSLGYGGSNAGRLNTSLGGYGGGPQSLQSLFGNFGNLGSFGSYQGGMPSLGGYPSGFGQMPQSLAGFGSFNQGQSPRSFAGFGQQAQQGGEAGWAAPVDAGGIYGQQKWSGGNGIDVFLRRGSLVYAPFDGYVGVDNSNQSPFGPVPGVNIQGSNGYQMSAIHVQPIAQGYVRRGQPIGRVDDNGLDILGPYQGMPDNFQHADLRFGRVGESLANVQGGSVNAIDVLRQTGYQGQQIGGTTRGPQGGPMGGGGFGFPGMPGMGMGGFGMGSPMFGGPMGMMGGGPPGFGMGGGFGGGMPPMGFGPPMMGGGFPMLGPMLGMGGFGMPRMF